ncbi:MAG: phosphotransferase [Oscillospiraceae bacterium]|jgi:tRNA A-37 threonylcarbamoyl transferase component Bud32|nr:phosphotransferase [Oscillospiraceae bacterium]
MKKTKIIIFGAGNEGRALADAVIDYGDKISPIECFVDNDPSLWYTQYNGIYILSLEKLCNMKSSVHIIISIANDKYVTEIEEQLEKMGFVKNKDFYKKSNYNYFANKYWVVDNWVNNTYSILHHLTDGLPNEGSSLKGKYIVKDKSNNKYFLVTYNNVNSFERVTNEQNALAEMIELDIRVPQIIEFGRLNNLGSYVLYEYIEGEMLNEIIHNVNNNKRYLLGCDVGTILKKKRLVSPTFKNNELFIQIEGIICNANKYTESNCRIKQFISHINKFYYFIEDRHRYLLWAEFATHNIIVSDEKLVLIDFESLGNGDDLFEFWYNVMFVKSNEAHVWFLLGVFHSFFNNDPSDKEWIIMSVYTTIMALMFLIDYENGNLRVWEDYSVFKHIDYLYKWISNIDNNIVPEWYIKKSNIHFEKLT